MQKKGDEKEIIKIEKYVQSKLISQTKLITEYYWINELNIK